MKSCVERIGFRVTDHMNNKHGVFLDRNGWKMARGPEPSYPRLELLLVFHDADGRRV